MPVHEWINVKVIKALSHHTTGALAGIIFFAIAGWAIEHWLESGATKDILKGMDKVGLVALFGLLLIKFLWHVVKGGSNGRSQVFVVA